LEDVFERSLKAAFIWSRIKKHQILWNTIEIWNNCFLCYFKCNLFMWCCIFSIITPVFSVTWPFRNHSNKM